MTVLIDRPYEPQPQPLDSRRARILQLDYLSPRGSCRENGSETQLEKPGDYPREHTVQSAVSSSIDELEETNSPMSAVKTIDTQMKRHIITRAAPMTVDVLVPPPKVAEQQTRSDYDPRADKSGVETQSTFEDGAPCGIITDLRVLVADLRRQLTEKTLQHIKQQSALRMLAQHLTPHASSDLQPPQNTSFSTEPHCREKVLLSAARRSIKHLRQALEAATCEAVELQGTVFQLKASNDQLRAQMKTYSSVLDSDSDQTRTGQTIQQSLRHLAEELSTSRQALQSRESECRILQKELDMLRQSLSTLSHYALKDQQAFFTELKPQKKCLGKNSCTEKTSTPATTVTTTKKKSSSVQVAFSVLPVTTEVVYQPVKGDSVDKLVAAFTNARNNKVVLTRVKKGVYLFGRLLVAIQKDDNKNLRVRYDHQTYTLPKFIDTFEDAEFAVLESAEQQPIVTASIEMSDSSPKRSRRLSRPKTQEVADKVVDTKTTTEKKVTKRNKKPPITLSRNLTEIDQQQQQGFEGNIIARDHEARLPMNVTTAQHCPEEIPLAPCQDEQHSVNYEDDDVDISNLDPDSPEGAAQAFIRRLQLEKERMEAVEDLSWSPMKPFSKAQYNFPKKSENDDRHDAIKSRRNFSPGKRLNRFNANDKKDSSFALNFLLKEDLPQLEDAALHRSGMLHDDTALRTWQSLQHRPTSMMFSSPPVWDSPKFDAKPQRRPHSVTVMPYHHAGHNHRHYSEEPSVRLHASDRNDTGRTLYRHEIFEHDRASSVDATASFPRQHDSATKDFVKQLHLTHKDLELYPPSNSSMLSWELASFDPSQTYSPQPSNHGRHSRSCMGSQQLSPSRPPTASSLCSQPPSFPKARPPIVTHRSNPGLEIRHQNSFGMHQALTGQHAKQQPTTQNPVETKNHRTAAGTRSLQSYLPSRPLSHYGPAPLPVRPPSVTPTLPHPLPTRGSFAQPAASQTVLRPRETSTPLRLIQQQQLSNLPPRRPPINHQRLGSIASINELPQNMPVSKLKKGGPVPHLVEPIIAKHF